MKTILIIGAGEIGSRHLQALARSEAPFRIQVISRSATSLNIANERFLQVNNNASKHLVEYYTDLHQTRSKVDIAIISTNSDVRKDIIKNLLNKANVSYLIFEKVLFQKLEDFEEIEALLKQKGIRAWVNCFRRSIPFYKNIKKDLNESKKIYYTVQGGDWNLASNAIHFIDLFSFLTEETDIDIDINFLDKKIKESKRKGFMEFSGKLYCRTKRGSELVLLSESNLSAPFFTTIMSEQVFYIIDETAGNVKMTRENTAWKWEETNFKFYYQSEFTHLAVKEILETGSCSLTPFHNSALLHKPMIEGFICHLERITNQKWNFCPIT